MARTFFGREEPTGRRRLASDFDLIAKWAHAFSKVNTGSYPLSGFSSADQEQLLRQQPHTEFRIEPDEAGKLRLKKAEVCEGTIDPELLHLLYHPKYRNMMDKHFEMMNAIENASPSADVVANAARDVAKLDDLDDESADALAKEAFNHSVDEVALALRRKWKREEQLKKQEADVRAKWAAEPISFGVIGDGRPKHTFSNVSDTEDPESVVSESSVKTEIRMHQTVPNANKNTPPPVGSSPAHGSETTTHSPSADSPAFLPSHEYLKSPQSSTDSVGSQTTPVFGMFGGAALDPLAYGGSHHNYGGNQGVGVHLGAGLIPYNTTMYTNAPFFADATRCGFHSTHMLAPPDATFVQQHPSQAVNNASLAMPYLAAYHPGFLASPLASQTFAAYGNVAHQFDTESLASTLATQKAEAAYFFPKSADQPYGDITFYDVPLKSTHDTLMPEYWTTREDKARLAVHKSNDLKADDELLMCHPELGPVASNPIHIFVDLSNIIIGFYNSLKTKRRIPVQKRVSPPPFSFENLDAIITRGRTAAKKVVAGSVSSFERRRPDYMLQAEDLGYEMCIMLRIPKPVSPTLKRRSKVLNREGESATSGPDSSGDDYSLATPRAPAKKKGEQGVDELLHLKILQSAIDTRECGTIALATGDAAHAEYSDGFKKNVERVLESGWNVELYGWSRNISSAWRDPAFTSKWGRRFRIIELDSFCEELFDMGVESLQYE